jgi:hypothetical protein
VDDSGREIVRGEGKGRYMMRSSPKEKSVDDSEREGCQGGCRGGTCAEKTVVSSEVPIGEVACTKVRDEDDSVVVRRDVTRFCTAVARESSGRKEAMGGEREWDGM